LVLVDAIRQVDRTVVFFSREPQASAGLFSFVAGSLRGPASFEVDHPHDHCAVRLEEKILKSPSAREGAHGISSGGRFAQASNASQSLAG
jgi:hypothetical protein